MEDRSLELEIEGMHCAACLGKVEKALQLKPDWKIRVSLPLEKAILEWETTPPDPEILISAIKKAGYTSRLSLGSQFQEQKRKNLTAWKNSLRYSFVSILLSTPLLFGMGFPHFLPPLVLGFLGTVVILGFGFPFHKNIRRGGMDTLVSMASLSSLGLGYYEYFNGMHGFHSLESGAMVVSFVLLGKSLELYARKEATTSYTELLELEPQKTEVRRGKIKLKLEYTQIQKGDQVFVLPNELIPVDGIILEGISHATETHIHGEKEPVPKSKNDLVYQGSRNWEGSLLIEATTDGKNTHYKNMITSLRNSLSTQPNEADFTSKVLNIFTPSILFISGFALVFHLLKGESWQESMVSMVSVLMVSCPCALGLATPMVLAFGSSLASRRQIFFKNRQAMTGLSKMNYLFLDKTGTITEGTPEIIELIIHDSKYQKSEILSILSGMAQGSNHPMGRVYSHFPQPFPFLAVKTIPGMGLEADDWILGSEKYMNERGLSVPPMTKRGTISYLAKGNNLISTIRLQDPLKKETFELLQKLQKMNIECILITGDRKESLTDEMIQLPWKEIFTSQSPESKSEILKNFKSSHPLSTIGMMGDGWNDSIALAVADVSISPFGASAIAEETSQIHLGEKSLRLVLEAILISQEILKRMKENLFFAFVYNICLIPLAFLGILSPLYSGLGMTLSSLTVTLNSFRILLGNKEKVDPSPSIVK